MAKRIRKFVDRAFAKTVDLELLRRLIEPYDNQIGLAWNLLPTADMPRREAVFELFRTADGRFPAELQFNLFNICCVATEAGARFLQLHAEEQGIELVSKTEIAGPTDGRRLSPRHLALVAWLDHRSVFLKALDAVAFLSHSSRLELAGRGTKMQPRQHDQEAQAAFARAVSAYFASRYQGRYCDVRWYSEEGSTRALVLHGSKASIKNVDADGAEESLSFREIVQDTIDYDIGRGHISIGAKAIPDARKLARLFAEHLLGNGAFFDRDDAANFYTLEPINEQGGGFNFNAEGEDDIADVCIREVQVDEGMRYEKGKKKYSPWAMTVRDNRNALRRLQELAPDADFGDLAITYVKIEFLFDIGGSESRVVVKVKPPTSVSFRDHSHEDLILDLLERNGIRRLRPAFPTAAAAE